MDRLRSLARLVTVDEIRTPKGRCIEITNFHVPFIHSKDKAAWIKDTHLQAVYQSLSQSHQSKRLVTIDVNDPHGENEKRVQEPTFGELAILRCLREDNWNGRWMDTYHRRIWADMSDSGASTLPTHAKKLYETICEKNEKKRTDGWQSGFFDVFAWKDGEYRFLEYKGEGDRLRLSQSRWIDAAIDAKIDESQLFFVSYYTKKRKEEARECL